MGSRRLVRRNYAQQFAAVVKHRRKGIPDDDQFVELLNEYLKVFDTPAMTKEQVLALEGDVAGGIPKIINAYLSFFGVGLVIDDVQRGDYRYKSPKQMADRDHSYIAMQQERMELLRKTTIGGDFSVLMIQVKVKKPDGTTEFININNPRNYTAWMKINDGMQQLLFDAIEDRKLELQRTLEKMREPKPKRT